MKNVITLTGHIDYVRSLIQLQKGKLASASYGSTIKIWYPLYYYSCITLTGHTKYVRCLIRLEDGKLASGSADMTIRIWDTLNNYRSYRTYWFCLPLSSFRRRELAASYDVTISLVQLDVGN